MLWAGTGLRQSHAGSQGYCQGSSRGYRDNTSGASCQIYHHNEKVRVSFLKGLSRPNVDQRFVPYPLILKHSRIYSVVDIHEFMCLCVSRPRTPIISTVGHNKNLLLYFIMVSSQAFFLSFCKRTPFSRQQQEVNHTLIEMTL